MGIQLQNFWHGELLSRGENSGEGWILRFAQDDEDAGGQKYEGAGTGRR